MMLNNKISDEKDVLSIYLKDINNIKMLSREEENTLVFLAQRGDKKSREKLINANLRFVVTVAKKYQNQGLALEDLINEGNIGLMIALDKFELEKGYHFISYAVWWIRQSIMKAICEKGKAVRLPLNRANELFQIQKAKRKLAQDSNEEVSIVEIADLVGLDETLVKDLLKISKDMISLDAPLTTSESSESKIADFIEDDAFGPEDISMQNALVEDINKVLLVLNEKERNIINLRFGLNNQAPMSLKEIGEIFNLTKERIRQIEKRALEKLSKNSSLLQDYQIA